MNPEALSMKLSAKQILRSHTLAAVLYLLPLLAGANQVVFTTTGTIAWTVPNGVNAVEVLVVGGGGGGGAHIGGGGGGGGVVYSGSYAVTPGSAISVTVGGGGAGGYGGGPAGQANSGANGQNSSFGTLMAYGGGGGGGAYSNGVNGGSGGGAGGVGMSGGIGSQGGVGGSYADNPWRGGGGGGAGSVGVWGGAGSSGGNGVSYIGYYVGGGGGGGSDVGGTNPYSSGGGGGGGWGGWNGGNSVDIPAGDGQANRGGGGGGGGGGWCSGGNGGSGIVVVNYSAPANGISWTSINMPSSGQPGQTLSFTATVVNTGSTTWDSDYYLQLKDQNGTPLHYALISGTPPGSSRTTTFNLTLPTAPGQYTYYFTAMQFGVEFFGTTQARSITVSSQSAPVVTSASTANGTVGVPFSYQITATNSPTAYAAANLPPGLSISTGTGLVSGTPTTAGSYSTTVYASNASGTGSQVVSISVGSGGTTTLRFTTNTSWTVPNGVSSISVLVVGGGGGGGWHDGDGGGGGGGGGGVVYNSSYAVSAGQVISVAVGPGGAAGYGVSIWPTNGGDSSFGTITATGGGAGGNWNHDNGWSGGSGGGGTDYANSPGGSGATGQGNSGGAGNRATYKAAGGGGGANGVGGTGDGNSGSGGNGGNGYTDIDGIVYGSGGGGGTSASVGPALGGAGAGNGGTPSVVATNAATNQGGGGGGSGNNNGNGGNGGSGVVVVRYGSVSAPVINSPTTASGATGASFTYQITATNSPASYGASGLPAGLSIDPSSGLISGIPTTAGTTNATISATNSGGTGSRTLAITITGSGSAPAIISSPSASGNVGSAFTYQIAATNSPSSYGAGGLPAGLSVNTGSGLISGTPTAAGTTTATIYATNSVGTGSSSLAIAISDGPVPSINSAAAATGTVGSLFNYRITATNSPTRYDVVGTIPPGLSLDSGTGLISGTPSSVGGWTFIIKATNANGTGSAQLAVTIGSSGQPTFQTFTTSDVFNVPAGVSSVTAFVVGGGGGGGWHDGDGGGGGGGGGGVVLYTGYSVSPAQQIGVTIGAGGNGGFWQANWPESGGDSSFGSIVATGGGGGGNWGHDNGWDGGAGGGGTDWSNSPGGAGIPGQGNAGGSGGRDVYKAAGGGGGAASVGEDGDGSTGRGGHGGSGIYYNYDIYGSGGGGGSDADDGGGVGAPNAGNGGSPSAVAGNATPNRGGGGGGSGNDNGSGGNGGPGIVIVTYTPPASSPPAITSYLAANGSVGSSFTYRITASGAPTMTFSTSALPAGLTLDTTSGIISGTPSVASTVSVTINAINSVGIGTATLTIAVSSPGGVPSITSSTVANGTVGSPFTYRISATNSPTAYSAANLPVGLSVNPTTGVISGTPTVAATANITISAINVYGTGTATLTLTIATATGDITTGLIGHWKFDEGSGTTASDSSGYGRTGALNSPTWISGQVGPWALSFDGDDEVNVPNISTTGGPITIAFWNYTALTKQSSAFGFDGTSATSRAQAHVPWTDGTMYWDYGSITSNGRITADYTPYLGKWTHVVLVSAGAGGGFKAIYLNGVMISSSTSSDGAAVSNLRIGRFLENGSAVYHTGKLDDFRIYSRVLSPVDITMLFNSTNVGSQDDTGNLNDLKIHIP